MIFSIGLGLVVLGYVFVWLCRLHPENRDHRRRSAQERAQLRAARYLSAADAWEGFFGLFILIGGLMMLVSLGILLYRHVGALLP